MAGVVLSLQTTVRLHAQPRCFAIFMVTMVASLQGERRAKTPVNLYRFHRRGARVGAARHPGSRITTFCRWRDQWPRLPQVAGHVNLLGRLGGRIQIDLHFVAVVTLGDLILDVVFFTIIDRRHLVAQRLQLGLVFRDLQVGRSAPFRRSFCRSIPSCSADHCTDPFGSATGHRRAWLVGVLEHALVVSARRNGFDLDLVDHGWGHR